jgi:dGTPase
MGVLSHNGEFAQQTLRMDEMNHFDEFDHLVERCYSDQTTIKTLRPSTLEGCVVRVSDMIAYLGKDRQDALLMGTLKTLSCFDSNAMGRRNTQIIHNITVDIINNSYGKSHLEMSRDIFEDLVRAKKQNYELIYNKEGLIAGTGNIVEDMFSDMYEKLLDDCIKKDEGSCLFKHHITSLTGTSSSIIIEDYLGDDPNQIVVDYMASMTDNYFIALYAHLFPTSEKRIIVRDYCADLSE